MPLEGTLHPSYEKPNEAPVWANIQMTAMPLKLSFCCEIFYLQLPGLTFNNIIIMNFGKKQNIIE